MEEVNNNLVFLKLGGSLITEKDQPMTPRPATINRIFDEIGAVLIENPDIKIILGHGSGSFGHSVGKEFDTRNGVQGSTAWQGFHDVFVAARALNQIIFTTAINFGLPVMPFPLSAAATVNQQMIKKWNLEPMKSALQRGLIPLVAGDVAFDQQLGGTILSTEEIFAYLAEHFKPKRILLAGIEPGIWADYPHNTQIVTEIRAAEWNENPNHINLQDSAAVDVTGGMRTKVKTMVEIIKKNPQCEIEIFSGDEKNSIKDCLLEKQLGTKIRY